MQFSKSWRFLRTRVTGPSGRCLTHRDPGTVRHLVRTNSVQLVRTSVKVVRWFEWPPSRPGASLEDLWRQGRR